MADGDLNETQTLFLEKYCSINLLFSRKKSIEKREEVAGHFKVFNTEASLVRKAVEGLTNTDMVPLLKARLAEADSIMIGKKAVTNLAGAMSLLDQIKKIAELSELQSTCRSRMNEIGPRVPKAMASNPDKRVEIGSMWEVIGERVETGVKSANKANLTASLEIMTKLDLLLAEKGLSGSVAEGKLSLAKGEHLAVKSRFDQIEARCQGVFDAAWPADLLQKRDKAGDALKLAESDTSEDISRKAKVAGPLVTEFTTLAETFLSHRAAWDLARIAATSTLTDLKGHKQKAAVPYVAPEIVRLDKVLSDAFLKADAFDYPGAKADISALPKSCADLTKVADDVAKLAAVRQVRSDLVATLKLPAGIPDIPSGVFEAVEKSVEDVKKLLADAIAAADGGRLAEAVGFFDEIPQAAEKARILIRHQNEYDKDYTKMKERCDKLAAKSGEVGLAIKDHVDLCKRQLRSALKLGDSDIDKAIQQLGGLWSLILAAEAKVADVERWITEKKDFDDRLEIVKKREGDEGRVAIEDFYQRMLSDKSRAEGLVAKDAAVKEWAMANQILTTTKAMQSEKIKLADVAKDYLAKKKALEERVKEVEKKTDSAEASLALANAKAFMTNAAAQTVAKDWKGSVQTLDTCKSQLDAVDATVKAAETIEQAKNDPALFTIATDFEAAFNVYSKAEQAARGRDAQSRFASLISAAAGKAQEARTKATTQPVNAEQAKTLLTQAIDDCKAIVRRAGEAAAFDVMNQHIRDALVTELPPRNIDDVIKKEIDDGIALYNTGATKTQAPGLDFGSALTSLDQAQALITKARRKVDAFDKVKKDRKAIDDAITALDVATYQTDLAAEIQRLKTLKQEITDLLRGGDTDKAVAKATEGGKLGPAFTTLSADYKKAKKLRQEWCLDYISSIEGLGTAGERTAFVADHLKQMRDLDAKMATQMTAKVFKSVQEVAATSYWIGLEATNIMTDGPLYEAARKTAGDELAKLTARRPIKNPFVADLVDSMAVRYEAAVAQAKLQNYTGATKRLDSFTADCAKAEEVLVKFVEYREARETSGKALGELAKVNDLAAIEPLVARLKGQQAGGIVMGDAGQFEAAKTEFDAVAQGCADALKASQEHQAFVALVENVSAGPAGDADAIRKQIAEGRKLIEAQKGQPASLFVRRDIYKASEELTAAEKLADTDQTAAGTHIAEAMRVCAEARMAMGLYTQMAQSEAKAQKDISDFLGQVEADFVREDLAKLSERLETTISTVRADPSPKNREAVQTEIEAVIADFLRLKLAAERQLKHVLLRGKINGALADMERHEQRFAMNDEIVVIRQMVATADGQAEKHEHLDAYERLERAQAIQDAAILKADMTGDKTPNVEDIKKILGRDGGSKQLDAIVAGLDDVAKRKVLRVAFEARFGCKLEVNRKKVDKVKLKKWEKANPTCTDEEYDEQEKKLTTYPEVKDRGRKGPNIQRFYDAMAVLPDSDTLDNDSMLTFETADDAAADGSFYNGGKKRVTMREGEFGDSGIYGVGLKNELEEIDPDSAPVDSEAITYFSWNTLHEVGHAVDDKLGFMRSRGGALGGWVVYGGNTYPVAQAVAGKFNFDAAYVSAYMSGTTEPPIPEPVGCDVEEWERRRVLCCAWVDRARSTNDPWQSSASAKKCEIAGICYQESYPGDWSSYPIAQRKKGVSGYQFRAPGEWFSELYAAFHTGKMNESHPARDWLEKL